MRSIHPKEGLARVDVRRTYVIGVEKGISEIYTQLAAYGSGISSMIDCCISSDVSFP